MTIDLQALWQENRRWRQWMDANTSFVTPSVIDTLRYSLIEASEALDAWMRSQNPSHARNNGREHTIEQELADTAMLLLTALPNIELYPTAHRPWMPSDLDGLTHHICSAIWHFKASSAAWLQDCCEALYFIAHYPGFDLAAELDKCHRRLAWKHGSAALAAAGNETPWMVEAEAAA